MTWMILSVWLAMSIVCATSWLSNKSLMRQASCQAGYAVAGTIMASFFWPVLLVWAAIQWAAVSLCLVDEV